MEIGTAKVCITPEFPVRLSGFANRKSTFQTVLEDIFIRVQIHAHAEKNIYFIYGDLLWWGSDFVSKAKALLRQRLNIPPKELVFVASHNHSGPPTSELFTETLETYSLEYETFLLEKVLDGIVAAKGNLEEVEAYRYDGAGSFSVFRRVIANGEVKMQPNYRVAVDRQISIIAYRRKNDTIKACMIHYPCHANISGDNTLHPDYSGIVLRMIDEVYPDSISIFLQGCTGDTRPNHVLGEQFATGSYSTSLQFAEAFSARCCEIINRPGRKINLNLKMSVATNRLSLENLRTNQELNKILLTGEIIEKQWAEKVIQKGNRPYEVLEILYLDYGDNLKLLFLNSETSQYYAKFAKSLDKDILTVSYTNGMIGYICTEEQIKEGGYEPEGSALYFALAGTYSPSIEAIIHERFKELYKGGLL